MKKIIYLEDAIDAISSMFAPTPTLMDMKADCLEIIENLPSAIPEPSQVARDIATIIENEMDMRVIERNDIVRCKDCKHWGWTSNRIPEEQAWHCYCWDAGTGKDDFCSFAERREGETNET